MKCIRVLPETGWTGVDNSVARSRRISWRAKGLLLELLSYPETNDITIAKLAGFGAKARKEGRVAEGREALQAAMRELEREGYVVHHRTRDKASGHWSTTTYVSTDPAAIADVVPSTALPRPVNQRSGDRYSADPYSVDQSLSTYKTDEKTDHKTEEEEGGLQSSSSLASAREGAAGQQDRAAAIEADLQVRYEAVRAADETYLRDRLLKFERKRPAIYRKQRDLAIRQIENGEWPKRLQEVGASRLIDELAMMYAIRHYAHSDSGIIPEWLFRFRLRSVS